MNDMLERVEATADGPVVRKGGVAVAEIVRRIEAGDALEQVGKELALDPADLIAGLAALGLDDLGPPLVQDRPRLPSLGKALSEPSLAKLLPEAARPARLALAAGLLQIHDFWEASHQAAQEADDLGEQDVSAYWHGIAHRREPDPGNASYWFRRVGRHPLLGPLGGAASELIAEQGGLASADRLVRGGTWDPSAFIAFCGAARHKAAEERLARKLQRLEMAMLLSTTLRNALPT